MKPYLGATLWPSPASFPYVERRWPSQRGKNGWFQQYRTLMKRVRGQAQLRREEWCRVTGHMVSPLRQCHMELSVGKMLPACDQVAKSRACVLIAEFAAPGGPSEQRNGRAYLQAIFGEHWRLWAPFEVSTESLAAVGASKRLRGSRSRKRSTSSVGASAALLHRQGGAEAVVQKFPANL